MNYLLSELVNVDELQSLCEIFTKLTGFVTAILDMEGNVLIATGWQELCTEFHRKNPETAAACRESDTLLAELPSPGARYRVYRCNNGLVDVSVPISVDNLQIGRLYTGQFLFATPDVDFFHRQAAEYGFDETSYLEALKKVPIVTEEQVGQVMEFLCRLAEMIGRMGLGNHKLREANEELRVHRQELERLVDERTAELSEKNDQLRREIDERKHAEEALRFTQFAIDKTIDEAFWMTEDGRLFYVNDAACRTLGYAREELIGMSIPDIDPTVPMEVFAAHWRDLQENGSVTLETLHRAKDGRVYPVEIRANYVVFDGREYNCAFATDISERKRVEEALRESEEKYRAVADFTYDWETWLAPEGGFIYVSPSCKRITGYSADEFIKDPELLKKIIHPDDSPVVEKHFQEVLKGNVAVRQIDFRIITSNGEERWIEHICQPVFGSDSKWLGQRASNRDSTERKLAEKRINAALAEKEVLLKEIHHRVKNNLQIISTLLDLRFEKIEDEHSINALRESQERIKAMALLHEKLYQSSDLAHIDFADYVEKLALFLFNSYMADPERITLKLDAGYLPMEIDRAIPCGLIINELVSNALKHAFPDNRPGEISIGFHMGDDGRITLAVADNGIGMPEEIDPAHSGTLGLQLVSMLARQLRGRIEMVNDRGTSWEITFSSMEQGKRGSA